MTSRRAAAATINGDSTTAETLSSSLPSAPADENANAPLPTAAFGYERLLSDVSRAYCGYDESYFKSSSGNDPVATERAVKEAATARTRVLARDEDAKRSSVEPFAGLDCLPLCSRNKPQTDDPWLRSVDELTDDEFELRLRQLQSRFESQAHSLGESKVSVCDDWQANGDLPTAPGATRTPTHHRQTPAQPDTIEDSDVKMATTLATSGGASQERDAEIDSKSFIGELPLALEDTAAHALQRAFALANKPVSPPLQFAPLPNTRTAGTSYGECQ